VAAPSRKNSGEELHAEHLACDPLSHRSSRIHRSCSTWNIGALAIIDLTANRSTWNIDLHQPQIRRMPKLEQVLRHPQNQPHPWAVFHHGSFFLRSVTIPRLPAQSPSAIMIWPYPRFWPHRSFPQLCPVLHNASPNAPTHSRFTLECHGKDRRTRQSKRRRGQNHYRHQSGRLPRARRPQDPPRRLRSPGQCLIGARLATRR